LCELELAKSCLHTSTATKTHTHTHTHTHRAQVQHSHIACASTQLQTHAHDKLTHRKKQAEMDALKLRNKLSGGGSMTGMKGKRPVGVGRRAHAVSAGVPKWQMSGRVKTCAYALHYCTYKMSLAGTTPARNHTAPLMHALGLRDVSKFAGSPPAYCTD